MESAPVKLDLVTIWQIKVIQILASWGYRSPELPDDPMLNLTEFSKLNPKEAIAVLGWLDIQK